MLKRSGLFAYAIGIALCLALWWGASERYSEFFVPAPLATMRVAIELIADRTFWMATVLPTLARAVLGGAIAAALGIGLGLIAGYSRFANGVLEPPRLLLSALPAPVFVIVMLLWVGTRDQTIILAVGVLLVPLFFVATRDGLKGVDKSLMEMAEVYRVPLRHRLLLIVAPAVTVSLFPATKVAVANGLRLTILAEILVASGGFGEQISISRQYLETEKLFALVLLLVGLIICLEGMLKIALPKTGLKP